MFPLVKLEFQLREIYAVAVSKNIVETPEYKESFQLLGFQSRDELSRKIAQIDELLLTEIRKKNNDYKKHLEEFHKKLAVYVNNLKTVGDISDDEDMEIDEQQNEEGLFANCKDRTRLKNVGNRPLKLHFQIKDASFRNCWNYQKRANR